MRKKIVAANWKMNMNLKEAKSLCKTLLPLVKTNDKTVVFCVPSINITEVGKMLKGTNVKLGAQNMFYEEKGAYTGEISADMLLSAGVEYVIIGHSERRQIFKENDVMINKKIKKALAAGLIPIMCVGETLTQREKNETLDHIKNQLEKGLKSVSKDDIKNVVLAYEPIWAIGTGHTATSKQAEDVCAYIRKVLTEMYDKKTADEVSILYGGSVNEKNAKELFSKKNIDGGLIGGASLKSEFADITNS